MDEEQRITISHEELFDRKVDDVLASRTAIRQTAVRETPKMSPLRRVLLSKMFYLTAAGLIGTLLAWNVLEPIFDDFERIGGEVNLIQTDPFICTQIADDCVQFTVGTVDVIVLGKETRFEPGMDGEQAFASLDEVVPGTFVEIVGEAVDSRQIVAMAIRPSTKERAKLAGQELKGEFDLGAVLFFPVTALFLALFIILSEGAADRNWRRAITRSFTSGPLAFFFAALALIPTGLLMLLAGSVLEQAAANHQGVLTVDDLSIPVFMFHVAARSIGWTFVGAGVGLGMNLVRSTKLQLRNSVLGGALGGAFGGMFFDPIDRFFASGSLFDGSELSRLVGLCFVGAAVGFFVALSEHMAREAWILVRTGPLAGKSFILYRTPTIVGSSTQADIYLFKDAGIDPEHAGIHRIGSVYELERIGDKHSVVLNGVQVRRHRLVSGDQIVLGDTVLDFEERAKAET
jgi:hypothetical protein